MINSNMKLIVRIAAKPEKNQSPKMEDRMPRTPTWQKEHAHSHTTRFPEHEHGELATQEAMDLEHAAMDITEDSFEQGPEANRDMNGAGQPEEDDVTAGPNQDNHKGDDLTATGQPSNGPTAQTGFGDHVVNTEDDEGVKFLALLDERKEIKALAGRFTKVNFEIKKQLITRGLISGTALRIRVAAHILNLSDKSEDKEQDAKTRAGTQHLSVVHPG